MTFSGWRLWAQKIHLRQCWYNALEAPASLSHICGCKYDFMTIPPKALISSIKAHLGSTSWHPHRKWCPLAEPKRSAIDNKTSRSILFYFPTLTERARTENCFCNFIHTCYRGIGKGSTQRDHSHMKSTKLRVFAPPSPPWSLYHSHNLSTIVCF